MATIWEQRYARRKFQRNRASTRSFSRSYPARKKYIPLSDREWDGEVVMLESFGDSSPVGGRMKGRGKRVSNARKARAGV